MSLCNIRLTSLANAGAVAASDDDLANDDARVILIWLQARDQLHQQRLRGNVLRSDYYYCYYYFYCCCFYYYYYYCYYYYYYCYVAIMPLQRV